MRFETFAKVLVLVLIVTPLSALSQTSSGAGTITFVEVRENGRFRIQLQGPQTHCPGYNDAWVAPNVNGVTTEGARALLSLALAAHLSGKPVKTHFGQIINQTCYVAAITTPN